MSAVQMPGAAFQRAGHDRKPITVDFHHRVCIKAALLDMARHLAKYNHTWEPRMRNAFIHAYNAVKDPGEPSAAEMFRGTRPDEDTRSISERMVSQGFVLPPSAR